jgi:hypothetical protein
MIGKCNVRPRTGRKAENTPAPTVTWPRLPSSLVYVSRRCWVRILTGTPAVLTEAFRRFSQSLQYLEWATTTSFPIHLSYHLTVLSLVWVTIDGVWIGDWIYWPLTDCTELSLIHALVFSLQHALSLFSLLCLHQSLLLNGFQRRKFPFLWVPELSPCLSYQFLTATAYKNWASAVL